MNSLEPTDRSGSEDSSSVTKKSFSELEIDDAELRLLKTRLTAEKQALQAQLAGYNAQCCETLPMKEYHRIRSQRSNVVRQLMDKEGEIADVNSQIRECSTVLNIRKRQAGHMITADVRALVTLRDEWHDFSMEKSNHQKAREVAWKVSQQLRELLKPYFDGSREA